MGLSWVLLVPQGASAKPKTHTVYAGQRLGSIAKRYNVSIDELCAANGITRSSTIRPGQKLIIPGTDDGKSDKESASKKDKGDEKSKKDSAPSRPQGKTRTHIVAKGHTLSAIAGRYAITVTALCNANGISRHASLTVGEKLIIPHKTDKDGEYAKKQRTRGDFDEESDEDEAKSKSKESRGDSKKSWAQYVKPAWKSGFIKIRRYGRYWEGYVIGPKNEVLGHASNKINFVLGAHSDGPRIDPKLVRLIASSEPTRAWWCWRAPM
jgi:LysM repeat protein